MIPMSKEMGKPSLIEFAATSFNVLHRNFQRPAPNCHSSKFLEIRQISLQFIDVENA